MRFSQFLTLVGLTALVVGGVGVANAVASFVDMKRASIATLKCLGASRNLVFAVYLTQILMLAALGIALGLVVGAVMPFIAKWALADLVPVSAIGLYPRELGLAVLCGLLVTLSLRARAARPRPADAGVEPLRRPRHRLAASRRLAIPRGAGGSPSPASRRWRSRPPATASWRSSTSAR